MDLCNDVYSKLPNLVIAFQGCDKTTFENVLYNHQPLHFSTNSYDWLGHGMYFWENSYERAIEWAETHKTNEPAVIGAVLDLGYCLNLTDYKSAALLKLGYDLLKLRFTRTHRELPQNTNLGKNKDLLNRKLDCAVIEEIHQYHKDRNLKEYDSARGVFFEGKQAYPHAGFREKTHIQLCIRNPNCIKGYFCPSPTDEKYEIP